MLEIEYTLHNALSENNEHTLYQYSIFIVSQQIQLVIYGTQPSQQPQVRCHYVMETGLCCTLPRLISHTRS